VARLVSEEVSKHMQRTVRDAELKLARAADELIRERLASAPASTAAQTHQRTPPAAQQKRRTPVQSRKQPQHQKPQQKPQQQNLSPASTTATRSPPAEKQPVAPNVEKDVLDFLHSVHCAQYVAHFQAKGYWSMRLVKQLHADDLPELGINDARDREAILRAVQKFRREQQHSTLQKNQKKKTDAEKKSAAGGDSGGGGGLFDSITGWFGSSSEPSPKPTKRSVPAHTPKKQSSQATAQPQQYTPEPANAAAQQQQQVQTQSPQQTSAQQKSGVPPLNEPPTQTAAAHAHTNDTSHANAPASLTSPRDAAQVDDLLSQAAQTRAPVLRMLERAGSNSIRGRRPPTRKNLKLGSTVAVKEEAVNAPKPDYDPVPAVSAQLHTGAGGSVQDHTSASATAPRRLPPGATPGPGVNLAAAAAAKLSERRAAAAAAAATPSTTSSTSVTDQSASLWADGGEEDAEVATPAPMDAAARRREELAQRAARSHQPKPSSSAQVGGGTEAPPSPQFDVCWCWCWWLFLCSVVLCVFWHWFAFLYSPSCLMVDVCTECQREWTTLPREEDRQHRCTTGNIQLGGSTAAAE
jgi:SAM domain (Sterile alpha motif)